jgi:carboxyl-terminal processing protease
VRFLDINKKKWIAATVAIVLLTNVFTYFGSGVISSLLNRNTGVLSASEYEQAQEWQKLFFIKEQLDEYYDGEIDEDVMLEGAIKGMTESLQDPYTVYFNKEEYSDFNTQTEGNYSGVGLQVKADGDNIVVVGIFDESPAKNAGILPNDVIEKVDDTAVTGSELEKAVSLMKGQEGTSVRLTLYRESKGEFEVTLTRAQINIKTISGEMIDSEVGLIEVTMFDSNTAQNFRNMLEELKGKGMKSLIIDLRGNPGGLLNECVSMASNFIEENQVVVSTVDKYENTKKYRSEGGVAMGMPLVILTDEGSASASEIFAGAIRDYKLGTLVGTTTFGKGVVQTILEAGDGTALKVTVSKYYTPNGENINKTGIKPDVEVVYPESLYAEEYDRSRDPQFVKALEIAKSKIQ